MSIHSELMQKMAAEHDPNVPSAGQSPMSYTDMPAIKESVDWNKIYVPCPAAACNKPSDFDPNYGGNGPLKDFGANCPQIDPEILTPEGWPVANFLQATPPTKDSDLLDNLKSGNGFAKSLADQPQIQNPPSLEKLKKFAKTNISPMEVNIVDGQLVAEVTFSFPSYSPSKQNCPNDTALLHDAIVSAHTNIQIGSEQPASIKDIEDMGRQMRSVSPDPNLTVGEHRSAKDIKHMGFFSPVHTPQNWQPPSKGKEVHPSDKALLHQASIAEELTFFSPVARPHNWQINSNGKEVQTVAPSPNWTIEACQTVAPSPNWTIEACHSASPDKRKVYSSDKALLHQASIAEGLPNNEKGEHYVSAKIIEEAIREHEDKG